MHSKSILLGYFCFYFKFSNLVESQINQQDHGIFFKFINKQKLVLKTPSSILILISHLNDKNGCVSYCLTYASCKSANFRISTRECSLFGVNSWEIEFNIVSNIEYIIIQKIVDPVVTHGEWTLVFRGLAKINKPVYYDYTNTSLYHDQPLSLTYPTGCLRLDTNLSCDHHFRSKLLNNWSNLSITEVKFGIYKDGAIKQFLLFNGSSSTVVDWFSSARLMNSSWTDLKGSSVVHFSILGKNTSAVERHFFIQHNFIHCDNETGWFACIDKLSDVCPWGAKGPQFPRLIYSKEDTRDANINMTAADIIAIFIKF